MLNNVFVQYLRKINKALQGQLQAIQERVWLQPVLLKEVIEP